eukprot:1992434-Pleurochrysis_carterae.AAC.2
MRRSASTRGARAPRSTSYAWTYVWWAAPAREGSAMRAAKQIIAQRPKPREGRGKREVRRRVNMGCHEPPGHLPCASGGWRDGEKCARREHDSGARRKIRCKKSRVGEARRRLSPGSRARATAYASAATRKAKLKRMDKTEAKGQLGEGAERPE